MSLPALRTYQDLLRHIREEILSGQKIEDNMKKTLVSILLIFMIGCGVSNQTYIIADVAKAETITLRKQAGQGNIHGFSVSGRGQIEGEATMILVLNGKPYKEERLSGAVDFHWEGDWYSDSVEIQYRPSSVKGGKLFLGYKFKDM
jgi:hypothetical protein